LLPARAEFATFDIHIVGSHVCHLKELAERRPTPASFFLPDGSSVIKP
jgi:hypothetical protein